MNKLEKGKLEEIDQRLYEINAFISLQYIGLKKQATLEDYIKINDELARCIRQIRDLVK